MDPLWFDAIVAAVLLYALIRGAIKGLVWQLAGIAAVVLCFAFSETVSLLVAGWIAVAPPLNRWIAMFGLYVVAMFVCFGIAWKVHDRIEKWKLKSVDRQLGGVFGLLKGTVMVLVGMFFVVTLSAPARQAALRSHSGLAAALVMGKLHAVMPDELHEIIHPYIHQLDSAEHAGDDHAHHGRDAAEEGSFGRGGRPARTDPGTFSTGRLNSSPR